MSERALVLHGTRLLAVEDAPRPPVGPGEVRVVPEAVGVCGSDVHGYAGVNDRRRPGVVMGHEAAGRVAEVGPGVEGVAVGAPVAVDPVVTCRACAWCVAGRDNLCARRRLYGCVPELRGAFAESVVVRAENVVVLEGPAPLEWGALAEPFAVGVHACSVGGVAPGVRVLVVGGGPIGLGAALAARRAGADAVVVSEPDAHRREVLGAVGAEAVAPEAVRAGGFDVALECVGLGATLAAALAGVAAGGRVVLVGIATPELPLPVAPIVMEERAVLGSAVYERAEFAATARWIATGAVDLAPVIERRVALDELPDAFAAYAAGTERATKTVMVGA